MRHDPLNGTEQPVNVAGGIAFVDRGNVATHHFAEHRVGGKRGVEGAPDRLGADDIAIEALGDAVDDGVFQAVVIEHGGEHETRHRRLSFDDRLGLGLHGEPDRIDALQHFGGRPRRLDGHQRPPERESGGTLGAAAAGINSANPVTIP